MSYSVSAIWACTGPCRAHEAQEWLPVVAYSAEGEAAGSWCQRGPCLQAGAVKVDRVANAGAHRHGPSNVVAGGDGVATGR